jgi:hypothetical protein
MECRQICLSCSKRKKQDKHHMISWREFRQLKPDWADAAERLRLQPIADKDGIGFLATVSKKGRPRMAPVCPVYATGNLWLSVAGQTVKSFDLNNDGRFVLHAFLGDSDEEFQISGQVRIVDSTEEKAEVQRAITFQNNSDDMICELTLNRALWAYWINPGQPDTRVVRQTWHL